MPVACAGYALLALARLAFCNVRMGRPACSLCFSSGCLAGQRPGFAGIQLCVRLLDRVAYANVINNKEEVVLTTRGCNKRSYPKKLKAAGSSRARKLVG